MPEKKIIIFAIAILVLVQGIVIDTKAMDKSNSIISTKGVSTITTIPVQSLVTLAGVSSSSSSVSSKDSGRSTVVDPVQTVNIKTIATTDASGLAQSSTPQITVKTVEATASKKTVNTPQIYTTLFTNLSSSSSKNQQQSALTKQQSQQKYLTDKMGTITGVTNGTVQKSNTNDIKNVKVDDQIFSNIATLLMSSQNPYNITNFTTTTTKTATGNQTVINLPLTITTSNQSQVIYRTQEKKDAPTTTERIIVDKATPVPIYSIDPTISTISTKDVKLENQNKDLSSGKVTTQIVALPITLQVNSSNPSTNTKDIKMQQIAKLITDNSNISVQTTSIDSTKDNKLDNVRIDPTTIKVTSEKITTTNLRGDPTTYRKEDDSDDGHRDGKITSTKVIVPIVSTAQINSSSSNIDNKQRNESKTGKVTIDKVQIPIQTLHITDSSSTSKGNKLDREEDDSSRKETTKDNKQDKSEKTDKTDKPKQENRQEKKNKTEKTEKIEKLNNQNKSDSQDKVTAQKANIRVDSLTPSKDVDKLNSQSSHPKLIEVSTEKTILHVDSASPNQISKIENQRNESSSGQVSLDKPVISVPTFHVDSSISSTSHQEDIKTDQPHRDSLKIAEKQHLAHQQTKNFSVNIVSDNIRTSSQFIYELNFVSPVINGSQVISHPVSGFYAPVQISQGSALTNRLTTQYAVLSSSRVPYIERSLDLKKGDYKISFDWQADQPDGQLQIFFNHQLVGSFKASDNNARTDSVHIKACSCCDGKNLLKFAVNGSINVGLTNIQVTH